MAEATITIRLQVGGVDVTKSKAFTDAETALLEAAIRASHDESKKQDTPIQDVYFPWLLDQHTAPIRRQHERTRGKVDPGGWTP